MAERALATAFVNIVPGTKDFEAKLKGQLNGELGTAGSAAGQTMAQRVGSSFASKIKTTLKIGTAVAGVALAKFASDSIKTASDFGESANAINVAFGKNAEAVAKLGEDAATRLGMSSLEFNNSAVRFSSFADTIAGKGGDVAGVVDDITQRSADFASVFNIEVSEAMGAFQSGLAGETEPLKRFGINLSDAAIKAFAVKEGIVAAGQEMTDAQKTQARYGLLMEATAKTQGDFANTSDSLANAQRILKASFQELQIQAGGALAPAFASLVSAITPVVQQLGPVLKTVLDALIPAFDTLAGVIPDLLTALLPLAPVIAQVVGVLGEGLAKLLPVVVSLIEMLVPIVAALIPPLVEFLVKAIEPLIPAVISIIEAFQPLIMAILPVLATLLAKVVPIFLLLVNKVILPLIDLVVDLVTEMGPLVGEIFGVLAEVLIQLLPVFTQLLKKVLIPLLPLILELVRGFMPLVMAVLPLLVNLLKAFVVPLLEFLAGVISKLVIPVLGFLVKIITTVIGWFAKLIEWVSKSIASIVNFFKDLPKAIQNALSGAGKWLVDIGKNIIQGLLDGAGSLLKNLGQFFLDMVPDWIEGPFKKALGIASPSKVFKEFGRNIIQGLNKGLLGGESSVKSTMDKVSKWVADKVKSGDLPKAVGKAAQALVKTYKTKLLQLTREHDKVIARLEEAQEKLADRLQEKLDFVKSISEKYGAGYELDEEATAATAIQGLKDRITKTRELSGLTDKLIAMGLNEDLYRQIVEAQAVDFARSIIEGGQQAVDELNVLADEANKQAVALAERVGSVLFDEGIKFAQSVVDGLESEEERLTALMDRVARSFAAQLQAIIAAALGQGGKGYKGKRPGPEKDGTKKGQISKNGNWRWNGKEWVALAKGGFVDRPTPALIGEAGPEVVMPLADFERIMGLEESGASKTINYYAAPNQSLDSERALFTAMKRAEVIAGW